jgi:Tfp pilus assembly protein PilF
LQHQIDSLKQQQNKFYALSSQIAPGGCDHGVMHDATQRGDDKLAHRDYDAAIDYFEDAASACPNDAAAEFNLARAYEAEGERDQASAHYKRAAKLGVGPEADVGEQARVALSRIVAGR